MTRSRRVTSSTHGMTLYVMTLACMFAMPAKAEIACPDSLSVRQLAEVPAGWSLSVAETPPRLTSVALFDGQPVNRASLKVTKRQHAGNETRILWKLPETPRSIYLQCSYERTAAQISTPLPPGTSVCEVAVDRTRTYPSGANVIRRMVCK